jgi:hypothetical protein
MKLGKLVFTLCLLASSGPTSWAKTSQDGTAYYYDCETRKENAEEPLNSFIVRAPKIGEQISHQESDRAFSTILRVRGSGMVFAEVQEFGKAPIRGQASMRDYGKSDSEKPPFSVELGGYVVSCK